MYYMIPKKIVKTHIIKQYPGNFSLGYIINFDILIQIINIISKNNCYYFLNKLNNFSDIYVRKIVYLTFIALSLVTISHGVKNTTTLT